MKHKKGPLTLLALLVISLSFLLGVHYGKRVHVTDKAIEEIVRKFPTPTMTIAPSRTPRSYILFTSKACALSFVHPSDYTVSATGTQSAHVTDVTNRTVFSFDCGSALAPFEEKNSTAAILITLNGKEYKGSFDKINGAITISFKHPRKNTPINLVVSSEFQALIERSLQFLP